MWIEYNPNPKHKRVGDCVIRGICSFIEKPWEDVYIDLVIYGFKECDMPSSNYVWQKYLSSLNYMKHNIPENKRWNYTIKDFCEDNPKGKFLLGTGTHVVFVNDGNYYDVWDSGDEVPIFYWC